MGEGGEGRRPLFESSIYYSHESANTHNVNTGDKSVWYIFLYTEKIFYVYFTNQTNWIMIYTWPYYLLVCKRFIFFFSCLRTIYFSFLAFANNFSRIFHPPFQKIAVGPLKQYISQNDRIDVSKTLAESGGVHNYAWEISPQPLCRKRLGKMGLLQGCNSWCSHDQLRQEENQIRRLVWGAYRDNGSSNRRKEESVGCNQDLREGKRTTGSTVCS